VPKWWPPAKKRVAYHQALAKPEELDASPRAETKMRACSRSERSQPWILRDVKAAVHSRPLVAASNRHGNGASRVPSTNPRTWRNSRKNHVAQPLKKLVVQPVKNHVVQPLKNHVVQPLKNHVVQLVKSHVVQPVKITWCSR